MSEHFTRNTLECTAWCPRCQRFTQHRCDQGRQGPCIDAKHPQREFSNAQLKRREQATQSERQPSLFTPTSGRERRPR